MQREINNILIFVRKKQKIRESQHFSPLGAPGNYISFANPDGNEGHGYGKLNGKMKPMPVSADGFPYDLEALAANDEPELDSSTNFFNDDPNLQSKFASKTGTYFASKPDYVSRTKDPFSFFNDATVGLAESLIREYVKIVLDENLIRLKGRSSETDGATTQWGTRMPGGTQFGWSSAYQFPQKQDQYKPVFSLEDLMTKHEDQWDRTHGKMEPEPEQEWKEEYGEEEYKKMHPLFWE